jgi:hypothetical protein
MVETTTIYKQCSPLGSPRTNGCGLAASDMSQQTMPSNAMYFKSYLLLWIIVILYTIHCGWRMGYWNEYEFLSDWTCLNVKQAHVVLGKSSDGQWKPSRNRHDCTTIVSTPRTTFTALFNEFTCDNTFEPRQGDLECAGTARIPKDCRTTHIC